MRNGDSGVRGAEGGVERQGTERSFSKLRGHATDCAQEVHNSEVVGSSAQVHEVVYPVNVLRVVVELDRAHIVTVFPRNSICRRWRRVAAVAIRVVHVPTILNSVELVDDIRILGRNVDGSVAVTLACDG